MLMVRQRHIKSEINPRRVHIGMHFSEFLDVSLAIMTTLLLSIHLSTTLTYMTGLTGYHFITTYDLNWSLASGTWSGLTRSKKFRSLGNSFQSCSKVTS
jgi:hypothetical protein